MIKKLLKSDVCRSHEQCTGPIGVHRNVKNHGSTVCEQYSIVHEQRTYPLKLKCVQKKKKEQNAKCKRRFIRIQTLTKINKFLHELMQMIEEHWISINYTILKNFKICMHFSIYTNVKLWI